MRTQELQKVGLSEKESAIYIALLELGTDTVHEDEWWFLLMPEHAS